MLRKATTILFSFLILSINIEAQCLDCGNGSIDIGETNLNCPQDVSHNATCTSPCTQPGSFESTVGIRQSFDFSGTTTYSTAGLPVGWAFAGAPTATTAGALPAADVFGAKAGLVQPNCSGGCAGTNFFCIGNLASNSAVGGGGTNGKLGANFDGRPNVSQNLSYAVLRGQNSPTLVSSTFDMSSVNGFKVQFWLFPSETSCGQLNSWGSCVGNVAYLDFSANGGTSWTQIMTMNLSSSNSDMCTNNTTNTLWLKESAWSRVCLTVFRNTSASGNFYSAANAATAASGMMVNSAYFTSTFKFRIRYSQTASCTSASATNPGRYLAIDYPVITSGNEMIPCGISFSNMCGYGADNNDDGVGSSTLTTTTTVFGTTRISVNQAERGVEILTSQNSLFDAQNLSGSAFATNYDLCNPEGGDKQCIDWFSDNNFYTTVYECISDWEAASGTGINVQYYEGTTPQSVGMTKVTSAGKTATIGWRYSANRIVSCGSTTDLNPGCNGYSFRSSSLPTQFARGFYALAINSSGQSWPYYGASSCSHYFSGPFFSPVSIPDTVGTNMVVCSSGNPVFSGTVDYCSTSSGFTGSAELTITGPNSFSETIASGTSGTTTITDPGDYFITSSVPTNPSQCLDCGRSVCITLTAEDLDICGTLPVELLDFTLKQSEGSVNVEWITASEINNDYFEIERGSDYSNFEIIGEVDGAGVSNTKLNYEFLDVKPLKGVSYYRLKQVDFDGKYRYSEIESAYQNYVDIIFPNPSDGKFNIKVTNSNSDILITNMIGQIVYYKESVEKGVLPIILSNSSNGIYMLRISNGEEIETCRIVIF